MSEPMRYSDGTYPEDRPEPSHGGSESHPEPMEPEDFTHYVHTADGRVHHVKVTEPLGSHYSPHGEDTHGGHFIVGTYPR